jgi:hypothetical protein
MQRLLGRASERLDLNAERQKEFTAFITDLADPRYGHMEPYRGMPPGHLPVRSYLAVPVVSRRSEASRADV